MNKNKESKRKRDPVEFYDMSAQKYSSDKLASLQLYMITCKCQTKENYDPAKKCMCTCSI